jgi:hypothetical protein
MALVLGLMLCSERVEAQQLSKRERNEFLYQAESANTTGRGNIWAHGRALFFIWDADNTRQNPQPVIRLFPELRLDVGIADFICASVESRPLSYPFDGKLQFGFVSAGIKATLPTNKDLRLQGGAVEVRYRHSFLKNFQSPGGYRSGGTGFSPEGFFFEGGSIEATALYELDLLCRSSLLPFRVILNNGMRIPLQASFREFSQYTLRAAALYNHAGFDAFIEYSFEGFIHSGMGPKKFKSLWGSPRVWEVHWSENPMYLTPGLKVRYANGWVLTAMAPLLLSRNQGSDMTYGGNTNKLRNDFPDEGLRGISSPFDPWFTKWKIVGQMTVPLRFKHTAAEMRRGFLLQKNDTQGKRIDIDLRLNQLREQSEPSADQQQQRQQRLEEIRQRREKALEEED